MMSRQPAFTLLQDNPRRFWEIVHTEDRATRIAALISERDRLAFEEGKESDDLPLCEILRYGIYSRTDMIQDLREVYQHYVAPKSDEYHLALLQTVNDAVGNTNFISINAFLPFIAEEKNAYIVGEVVINYVSLGPLTDNDPMSRVNDIIGMINSGFVENEGAAFGGLLYLGDPRICRLLTHVRDTLDEDAINQCVRCSTEFIHAAVVDFYLDWLEGMEGDNRDSLFGIVASGLTLLKRKGKTGEVFTGLRPIPSRNVTDKQWRASTKPVAMKEYVASIASRLYTLERSELPPKVMPRVLIEWGLQPQSSQSEWAVGDD